MNYVAKAFLLVSSSVLCFVDGPGQKSEQKHTTKDFVGFHNHSPLLTINYGLADEAIALGKSRGGPPPERKKASRARSKSRAPPPPRLPASPPPRLPASPPPRLPASPLSSKSGSATDSYRINREKRRSQEKLKVL